MKRFLAALLSLAVLLPILASCKPDSADTGNGPETAETAALRPVETIVIENGFQGEFHGFPQEFVPHGKAQVWYANGLFYIRGNIREEKNKSAFYIVSPEDGTARAQKIPLRELSLKSNLTASTTPCVGENGIAVLQPVYHFDPASGKLSSLAYALLSLYDFDGTLRWSADVTSVFTVTDNPLTGVTDTESPFYSLQNFFFGANGTVYLINDYSIVAIGENGEKLYETEAGYYIFDSMMTADGRVLVEYGDTRTERKRKWAYLDDSVQGFTESIEIPETELKDPVFVPGGGHDYYFYDRTGLYFMDEGDAEPTLLCSWEDSSVSYNSIKGLVIPDENTVFVFSRYDFNGVFGTPEYAVLKRPPADETNVRQVITLGVYIGYLDLSSYAAQFNRQSDRYHIVIRDYAKLASAGDVGPSTLLQEDILGGSAPDIVCFDYRDTENLAAKGAMVDLTPYLDADPAWKADLFSAAYEPLAIGGKTYHIASGIRIEGMSGKTKNLPSAGEWTPEAFLALADSFPADGDAKLISRSRKELTTALISNNLTAYVNFAEASCSFDSPRFVSVLQYLKKLPESTVTLPGESAITGIYEMRVAYRQDRLWIDPISTIGSFYQLMDLRGEFGGEEVVYLGMPSDGGGIPSMNAANTFSITADSPVKDGAWAFIRYILADEMIHYASPNRYLPVTRSNFEKQAELERKRFYFYPLDGTSGSWKSWDGETVPEYDRTRQIGLYITDEDVQFVLDLLTKRTLYPLVTTSYKTINSLINEELSAFFAGNVTAEDAARRIQSRVSIYLAEQS